jgi:hypothetical protein
MVLECGESAFYTGMESLTPFQKAQLEWARHNQLFAVVSWGCAATTWLAKVLNSHPEIMCLHAGNNTVGNFHSSMDSLRYFRVLSVLGFEYKAAGDVHGLPRSEVPKLKEAFGARFNFVIVVREPLARLRSIMALHEKLRGMNVWNLSYLDPLIEAKNIAAHSEKAKMFVHAANMLNAITEEISLGTIYKAEDLTTNPNTLDTLIAEISGGRVETDPGWIETCFKLRQVNPHAKSEGLALNDWEIEVVRAVTRPESWRLYEELGYDRPSFVTDYLFQ